MVSNVFKSARKRLNYTGVPVEAYDINYEFLEHSCPSPSRPAQAA